MGEFTNIETSLILKWLGDEIDIIINEVEAKDEMELIAIVSVNIEDQIIRDPVPVVNTHINKHFIPSTAKLHNYGNSSNALVSFAGIDYCKSL